MREIVLASVIVLLAAWELRSPASGRGGERFLEAESRFSSSVFRAVSRFMEGGPSCADPRAALRKAFAAKPLAIVHPTSADLPRAMRARCGRQTSDAEIASDVHLCLQLGSFLADGEAYAEIFYDLWDVAKNAAVPCESFNDAVTPQRGAKLFYTLYWRPKGDDVFFAHSGGLYGQSKDP